MSHEVSVTVEHPFRPGKHINIPLNIPGSDLSNLKRGEKPTRKQVRDAVDYALKSGRPDGREYNSNEEATQAADERSKKFGGQ